jgi:uncharacterized protein YndB with AHSA1/START domain
MTFQSEPGIIRWRLHLGSPPQAVYRQLSTDQGRAAFWAESAIEQDGFIHFVFPNQAEWRGRILEQDPPRKFVVEYYGGTISTFELISDGRGGTDLTLIDRGVPSEDTAEVSTGWVSVLLALKASLDFGADLRNHDNQRSWDDGYAEN